MNRTVILLIVGFFGQHAVATAGDTPTPVMEEPADKRFVATTLLWENDSFGGTDKHYTNGTRLELTLGATIDRETTFFTPLLRVFENHEEIYGTLFVGQNLYTPRDITTPAFLSQDRPYSGWLYSGIRFGTLNQWDDDQKLFFVEDALDYTSLEVSLGVVGPWALGGDTQTWFHDLIGAQEPLGWNNQLNNEVVLDTSFLQSLSFRMFEEPESHLSVDLEPFYNLRAGTVQVSAGTGVAAVLGLNHKLGATPRRLSYSGPLSRSRADSLWEVALFGSVEGRGVAWNTFLDGNVFDSSSHSVEKEHFIWHSEIGVLIRYHCLVASYIQVFRSEEFKGQSGIHEYGSGRIGFEFPF